MIRKFWPKWGFFENFARNRDLQIFFIKIEILRISSPKLRFSKILTNIVIFLNVGENRDISKILTSIKMFHQFWPKSLFFENLVLNRHASNKMEIFRRFWPKLKFSTVLTKIDIVKDFDRIHYFSRILTEYRIFRKFEINWDFSKIWPKSRRFENFDQSWDF